MPAMQQRFINATLMCARAAPARLPPEGNPCLEAPFFFWHLTPGGLISSPLVLVPGRAEGLESSPLGLMSSRPGLLAVAAELDALSRVMKDGSHPHSQCQQLSQARKRRATQVSEDGPRRGRVPSGAGRDTEWLNEARRRRGDEWFRQGSGTSRASLRAGSHHGLGIVLAWELAASSNRRGASSLGFLEVVASVVACDEPVSLAASSQW